MTSYDANGDRDRSEARAGGDDPSGVGAGGDDRLRTTGRDGDRSDRAGGSGDPARAGALPVSTLVVIAKEPRPGRVKTRLTPPF
ncbi:hypothetical protein ACWDTB_29805, partial [Streptomyces sp. NPDC003487]